MRSDSPRLLTCYIAKGRSKSKPPRKSPRQRWKTMILLVMVCTHCSDTVVFC